MATYTMYLHDVLASILDVGESAWLPGAMTLFNTDDPLLDENGVVRKDLDLTVLGLGEYPIFEDDYRPLLNRKIVDHYWNREIGVETVDLFRHQLRRKMNEIMPYYNQLYDSEKLKIEPLLSFRTTATNDTTTDAKARSANSEFPQTFLDGGEDYATGAADTVSKTVAGVLSSSEGFSTPQSSLLNEFRSTFLNIDLMVVSELEPLFMQLWSANDEFTPRTSRYDYRGFFYGLGGIFNGY